MTSTTSTGIQRNVPVIIYRRPPEMPTGPLPVPSAR
jgi:hypothetical protein